MEYIEAIWFTKPNHDGAPVMSLGTESLQLLPVFLDRVTSGVISKPANSTLS